MHWGRVTHLFALLAVALALVLAGCATASDRLAVPAQLSGEAAVPGLADVRVWGDAHFSHALLQAELPNLKAKYQERAKAGPKGAEPPVSNLLALSGGADDGAFGAGLLVGWSEQGDRPEFDLVTGISAGALIAPFAFLGRAYDDQLAGLFTSYGADQIYESNILSGIFGGNALANSKPLAKLIEKYVDASFLRRVAEERTKGRFLLVGTTNLDAQRPVYWDMGKIAQKGDQQALELFRRVLLASASIPGIFPPVLVQVEAGGQVYQEMHVDGGTTREVFFTIADFRFNDIDKAHRPQGAAPALDHPQRQDRARVQGNAGDDTRHRPALAGDADQEPRHRRSRAHVHPGPGRQDRLQLGGDPPGLQREASDAVRSHLHGGALRAGAGARPRRLCVGQGAARGHRRSPAIRRGSPLRSQV